MMLKISITLDVDGVLQRLKMNGHAGNAMRGENLACAAVSLTVRSVARLVAGCSDFAIQGDAPEPGNLFIEIIEYPTDAVQWLKGITDVLLQALTDIDGEYPGTISINIEV